MLIPFLSRLGAIAIAVATIFVATIGVAAADSAGDWAKMKPITPRGYVCYRASQAPTIDGKLDDAAWSAAPWTEPFVDIEGSARPAPKYKTQAKMLWDDEYFYIAAELEEPHVWGTLTKHDSVIFNDNDFEVFIDPNGDNHEYYELELNALNTTWDLFLTKPYKDGGKAENAWEIPGLKSAVHVRGTINNPADKDQGWSVEIAIPWKALREYARRQTPPRHGDQWRVDFSRVEWQHEIRDGKYQKVAGKREDNWVWSPQGIIDMHRPERWGYVQFSTEKPGTTRFMPDPASRARDLLMEIYHRQMSYRGKEKEWTAKLDKLGMELPREWEFRGLTIERNDAGYTATLDVPIANGGLQRWHVRQDSKIWTSDSFDEQAARIEAVLYQQADAWNRGDIDAFMEHYWKSDSLTFSSGGKTTRGWQATKENYRKRYPTRDAMGKLTFSQLEISPVGDGALVLGNWRLQREAPVGGNFSLTLRRIDNRWLIVHDHTSRSEEVETPLPTASCERPPGTFAGLDPRLPAEMVKEIEASEEKAIAKGLEVAGSNRTQIQQALDQAKGDHREGIRFLVANMPERDLKSLSADYLLENVRLAYQARDAAPWKEKLPKEIFRGYVLPYANINESRDRWRAEFREKFLPLIAEAKTPGQAAAILNNKVFPMVKVKYSTQRARADQSPIESIKSGLASCTGLSILLIDACRSVGVPARFVGTPMWTNLSGNHSWVEIWDDGWHFTGAAEPSGDKLDRGWFIDRAASAKRDEPRHAIYAASFQRTPLSFPLVWDRRINDVYAVNVTDRYIALKEKLPDGQARVMFRVLDRPAGNRLAANLKITDDQDKIVFEGQAKDDRFDTNDHCTAPLVVGKSYHLEVRHGDRVVKQTIQADRRDQPWTILLEGTSPPAK